MMGGAPLLRAWQDTTSQPSFSTDVSVINVLATVRDKDGRIVRDLSREDFTLLEDGRAQTIRYFSRQSDLPLVVGLLVDTSLSERNMLAIEREATRTFLKQVLRPEKDQAFLIHFDHDVELLQDVTSSRERLENALALLEISSPRPRWRQGNYTAGGQTWPGGGGWPGSPRRGGGRPGGRGTGRRFGPGGTAFYDAIYLASDEVLKKQSGRKALMLLTDGEDTASKVSLAEAISSCERADTLAYSIRIADDETFGVRRAGFERPDGKKILKQIAKASGGAYFEVSKKKSVAQIYSDIEDDLRNQYSLGYSSDRPAGDTGYRKISLTVKRKGLRVQSRDGSYPAAKRDAS